MKISVHAENGSMRYVSARDNLDLLGEEGAVDGTYSQRYQTPLLHFMTADQYCRLLQAMITARNGIRTICSIRTTIRSLTDPM